MKKIFGTKNQHIYTYTNYKGKIFGFPVAVKATTIDDEACWYDVAFWADMHAVFFVGFEYMVYDLPHPVVTIFIHGKCNFVVNGAVCLQNDCKVHEAALYTRKLIQFFFFLQFLENDCVGNNWVDSLFTINFQNANQWKHPLIKMGGKKIGSSNSNYISMEEQKWI